MIIELGTTDLKTRYGLWQEHLFYDGQKESIALTFGTVKDGEDLLCRVHSSCIYGHYFNSVECTCQEEMDRSMQWIQEAGQGVIILLDQEGKGNGHFALLQSIRFKREGVPQAEAYQAAGFAKDARSYGAAAKILQYLKPTSIRLLTNNHKKVANLEEWGIKVNGIRPLTTFR
ncbi:MAG: GTP cyclohydrolase [Bacteroidota bacterium]